MRSLMIAVAGCCMMLTGCMAEPPLPASTGGAQTLATVYRLGGGDKFKLNVFNEPSLSGGEYTVNGEGEASLPLVGPVKVGGLTMREAEAAIVARYAEGFLSNPRVNIDVVAFRPFYILGEVKEPGEYPYASGMTLLSAVAKAGGFTYRAQRASVYIRHAGAGSEEVVTIAADTPVLPGDTVRVIERIF